MHAPSRMQAALKRRNAERLNMAAQHAAEQHALRLLALADVSGSV